MIAVISHFRNDFFADVSYFADATSFNSTRSVSISIQFFSVTYHADKISREGTGWL